MKKLRKYIILISSLILILICLIFFWIMANKSIQSTSSLYFEVVFEGEYKEGDKEFRPISNDIKITNEDITLKGTFYVVYPDEAKTKVLLQNGQKVLLYFNHIKADIQIEGQADHIFDSEDELYGQYACGKFFTCYEFTGNAGDEVSIVLSNPHNFGNFNAVNEFLNKMFVYNGTSIENSLLKEGERDRIIGTTILVVSVIFIGISLFSFMLHFKQSKLILLLGLSLFFGSIYFIIDSPNIYYWNEKIIINTLAAYFSILFYNLFINYLMNVFLTKRLKNIGNILVFFQSIVLIALMIYIIVTDCHVYSTLLFLCILIVCMSVIWIILLSLSIKRSKPFNRYNIILSIIIQSFFIIDFLLNVFKLYNGVILSKIGFIFIFITALIILFVFIPQNFLAIEKQRELKAELEKTKTTIMLSQIQPHFLYNTLASIRYLCKKDPIKAQEALDDFSSYLRGNMQSLEEQIIPFSKELLHIKTYLKLEEMSFGDKLNIEFDIEEDDFSLPCLTVQPFVENAVKHGVCVRESGGNIKIQTKRKDDYIYIIITDDGVGFDTNIINENKDNHIGIRNVINRLEHMKYGDVSIESDIGHGTKVVIRIFK
ncbi:MAG: sensor histidine kinase [Anaeroplasmataceae bacterium]